MNYYSRPAVLSSLFALTAFGFAESYAPETTRMEPKTGKPGTVVKVTGKSLDKAHIAEVFLTDHRFDMQVKVLEQTSDHITLRVPPFAKPGRLQLLFLTTGATPVYLEQPLYLLVESSDDDTPAPIEISKRVKPTVEVAASGTSIPVPLAKAPPASPAISPGLEKSVMPLAQVAAASNPVPPVVPASPIEPERRPGDPVTSGAIAVPPPLTESPLPRITPQPSDPGNIPARIVQQTSVRYPPSASAQRIEGSVELIAVIRANGRVKDVKVVRGNPYFIQAAIAAVREWVYEPAYVHGKPVASEVPITLNFSRPH